MGRILHDVPLLILLAAASACNGCGGGSSVTQRPPPPPAPDFSLVLSSSSVSLQQGGTSSAVNISVNPTNGFTGNVQVTLSALPNGVTSNPASPFAVAGYEHARSVWRNGECGDWELCDFRAGDERRPFPYPKSGTHGSSWSGFYTSSYYVYEDRRGRRC